MINNDTPVAVGEAKEKRREEQTVNTNKEGRIKCANGDDAMSVDNEEDDHDEYDDLMSVEDDEEEDDDLDEALAAAQNMPLQKRKIRGRANGSNRKKKARIAIESTEPEITQEERDLRTLYITNVPFEVVESDFDIFKPFGEIHSIRISRTRSTGKLCGIAHVEFCTEESALKAIVKFSDLENKEGELHGRRIHVDRADSTLAKWHLMPSTLANRVGEFMRTPPFRLPKKMAKELVRLFKEKKYEGKNISCLKCAYEKTHLGKEKLDVSKYGFRKFSAALRTIPQFRLENLKLTIVAYLVDEKKDTQDAEKNKKNERSTTKKNPTEEKKEEKDEDEHPMKDAHDDDDDDDDDQKTKEEESSKKTTTEAGSEDTSAPNTHTFDDEEANKRFFLQDEDD